MDEVITRLAHSTYSWGNLWKMIKDTVICNLTCPGQSFITMKSTSLGVLLMIIEEEICHLNINFFDLSHPTSYPSPPFVMYLSSELPDLKMIFLCQEKDRSEFVQQDIMFQSQHWMICWKIQTGNLRVLEKGVAFWER